VPKEVEKMFSYQQLGMRVYIKSVMLMELFVKCTVPHGQLWVAPCWGEHGIVGHRAGRVLS
jgi:hypothetical protein